MASIFVCNREVLHFIYSILFNNNIFQKQIILYLKNSCQLICQICQLTIINNNIIESINIDSLNNVNHSKKSIGVSWKILCKIYIVKPMTNNIINIK